MYKWGRCYRPHPFDVVQIPRLAMQLRKKNVVQISCYADQSAILVDPTSNTIRQEQKLHFNKKEHSDVTFMVENKALYAKIDVLSRNSQYFQAMFRSNMREPIEGVVMVPDISASTFMNMLEYLCLDDFVVDDLDTSSREELGTLADMYMLGGLQLLLLHF